MSREIKFRAWTDNLKDGGEMYYQRSSEYLSPIFSPAGYGLLNPSLKFMQFTGLKDKNGKEIYFGDIIKYSFIDTISPDSNEFGTGLVTETINYGVGILRDWEDEKECIVYAVDQGGMLTDLWEDDSLWDIEVIGNICENPQLIINK